MSDVAGTSIPTPSDRSTAGWSRTLAAFFVWGVWAFMLIANLVVVYRYSPRNIPVSDELQELGGGAALTWTWLWEQHAEHRIPLAKLIWMGTLQLSDYDFRIGNLIEVVSVGAVALALMLAVRRLRGGTRWTDAFFPLAILNFGQTYPVFLWWWQVNHTLPPLIACVLLLILAKPPPRRPRDTVLAGVLLMLLSLSGPGGIPYVPPLALWLMGCGIGSARGGGHAGAKRQAILTLFLAALSLLLVVLYFVDYDRYFGAKPAAEFTPDGIKSALKTSIKLLSVSLGPSTMDNWKFWGTLVGASWLVGLLFTIGKFLTASNERLRAAGLLLFLVGNGALLLVLGWVRANYGDDNTFEGHYLSKGIPALCCVYFIFETYARSRTAGELQACLFMLILIPCLFFVAKHNAFLDAAANRRQTAEDMERHLRDGKSPYWLFQRYKDFHGNGGEGPRVVIQQLQHLREIGLKPFQNLPDEKDVPLDDKPISAPK